MMKMPRLYILPLLAALLPAAACSESEPAPQQHGSELQLEAEADPHGGGPTTTLNIADFKVTAYKQGPWGPEMLMDNVTVTRTGLNSWVYSPPVDWPVGQKVDFFAVSPAWVTMNNNSWWEHVIPFSARDDASTDLLVSVRTGVDQTSGRLKLNFRHALARVTLSLKCTLPGLTARVRNVALCNYADFGNFHYGDSTTSPGTNSGELYDCWRIYNTTSTYLTLFRAANDYIATGPDPVTVRDDLYFIPFEMKSLTTSASWEATLLEVTYQVADEKTGEILWPKDGLFRTAEVEIATATPEGRWVPGRSYHYVVDVGMPASRASAPLTAQCAVSPY